MMLVTGAIAVFIFSFIYYKNKNSIGIGAGSGFWKTLMWTLLYTASLAVFFLGLADFLYGQLPIPKAEQSPVPLLATLTLIYSTTASYLAKSLHKFLNR